jgi:RNA polymerase sigma-70 factor (ECF subfamily)
MLGSMEDLESRILGELSAGRHAEAATLALKGLGPQILGYLGAVLRSDDAADEVFAQFSEELWKSLPSFRGDSSFKTWAYQIVLHCVGRFRRDGFRRRARALATREISKIAEEVRSLTAPFLKTEAKDKLAALRATLDADEQTLLFLRIDQKLSWREIAQVMSESGIEEAALRKRFERLKERLSRELGR